MMKMIIYLSSEREDTEDGEMRTKGNLNMLYHDERRILEAYAEYDKKTMEKHKKSGQTKHHSFMWVIIVVFAELL